MAQSAYTVISGASRGLGECFANALAARKRNLVLIARSEVRLGEMAHKLRSDHGIAVEVLPMDLTSDGAASRIAEILCGRGIQIDMLINNAGVGARGEFLEVPLDRQMEAINLNSRTLVELTYHLLPKMIELGGAIVNVSSMMGFQPVPYAAAYAASKAFVTNFSMALAEELRRYDIRVVTLCPGGLDTQFQAFGHWTGIQFPRSRQDPKQVAEAALAALDRGRSLVVPRFVNRVAVISQRFVPRTFVPWLIGKMSFR